MLNCVKRFMEAEEGATAIEYGIMVAAIAAVGLLPENWTIQNERILLR